MPKRGSDADSRIFFDELVSLAASRLKATGAIRLEDRHGIIAFGDKQKLVGVAHTVFENGGSWSYFICPRCGGRKKKLWLVDDAPRCLSCCWSLGVRYRAAYGFGRAERLRERDRYVDRVQARRLRGAPTSAHNDDAPQHDRLPARPARLINRKPGTDGTSHCHSCVPISRVKPQSRRSPISNDYGKPEQPKPSNGLWIKRKQLSSTLFDQTTFESE